MVANLVLLLGIGGLVYSVYWISINNGNDLQEPGLIGYFDQETFQKRYEDKTPY